MKRYRHVVSRIMHDHAVVFNARDAMDGEGTLTLRLTCTCPLPAIRGHAASAQPFAAIALVTNQSSMFDVGKHSTEQTTTVIAANMAPLKRLLKSFIRAV